MMDGITDDNTLMVRHTPPINSYSRYLPIRANRAAVLSALSLQYMKIYMGADTKMTNNRGAAMIEFALVLPLLAILVFGIIEFGLIIYNKAMITNASREGARVGIVFRADSNGDYIPPNDPTVTSLIETRINDYLSTYLISFDSAAGKTISTLVTGTSPGGELKVTVAYPYKFLTIPSLTSIFGATMVPTITLSAVTSMRLE